jgi:dTDP-4-amino-4,6-dideoxygalactose transaminase
LPSDILAAFLFAQLEKRELIQSKRKKIWDFYATNLDKWARENEVRLPFIPSHCKQTYHMYYMICPSLDIRQRLIEFLKSNRIHAVFHYQPLHISDMGKRFGGKEGDCPETEYVSDRLIRLPFYTDMNNEDQSRIIEVIHSFSV